MARVKRRSVRGPRRAAWRRPARRAAKKEPVAAGERYESLGMTVSDVTEQIDEEL